MSDSTKFTEYRFFTPADFREEQAYLELKHRQGKAFVGVHNFKYTFKPASRMEMVYVRDYKEDDIFVDDYIAMYEESGWEFVYRTDEYFYFRTLQDSIVQPEELEIFSTDFDRAQYFGKLHMQWMSDAFVVLLVAVLGIIALTLAGCFEFTTFVDALFVGGVAFLLFCAVSVLAVLFIKYGNIQSIKLSDAEKQEKQEIEDEIQGVTNAKLDAYLKETSRFGEFAETDFTFEEILEAKLR